jgi:hypothetical protein
MQQCEQCTCTQHRTHTEPHHLHRRERQNAEYIHRPTSNGLETLCIKRLTALRPSAHQFSSPGGDSRANNNNSTHPNLKSFYKSQRKSKGKRGEAMDLINNLTRSLLVFFLFLSPSTLYISFSLYSLTLLGAHFPQGILPLGGGGGFLIPTR